MKIKDIYKSCINLEPQAQFVIYLKENDANIFRYTGGVDYKDYSCLPYGFYALREVEHFEVSYDGYTVHVELKPEG